MNISRLVGRWILVLVLVPAASVASAQEDAGQADWELLFDGESLDGWKVTDFGGQGKVDVKDGAIQLRMGVGDLTGITWTDAVERMDYEIEVVAMRVAGHDFFCGLTFPVKTSCCSLIVGGWGGSLVGISSFDDMDASENETTTNMEFDNGRWYTIRVRITENRIQAWIDGKRLVDARPGKRKISVRGEVDLSQPLGIAAWRTHAALRSIRIRPFNPEIGGGKAK
jgi:hypothetical protein